MRVYICTDTGPIVLITNHIPNIIAREDGIFFTNDPAIDERTSGNKYMTLNRRVFPKLPDNKLLAIDI